MPTPVVALNRAIAVAETEGPDAGLALLDDLAEDLDGYHLLHAARGSMLRTARATRRGRGGLRPRRHVGPYRHRHLVPEPAERQAHLRHAGKPNRLGASSSDGSGHDPTRRHAIGRGSTRACPVGGCRAAVAPRRRRSVRSSRTWTPTSSSWPAHPPWQGASGLRPVTASRRRCRSRSPRTRSTGWRWRCGGSTIRMPLSSCGHGRSRDCVTTAATPRRRPSRSGWRVSIAASIGVRRWRTDGCLGRDLC